MRYTKEQREGMYAILDIIISWCEHQKNRAYEGIEDTPVEALDDSEFFNLLEGQCYDEVLHFLTRLYGGVVRDALLRCN